MELEVVRSRKPLVLCPVDSSESCCGALRYAAAIAEHFQSELVIATVEDPLVNDVASMTAGEGHLAEETARELERFYHATFVDRPAPIAHPRFESAVGNPALEILALAARIGADLIVMSSRGASGVRDRSPTVSSASRTYPFSPYRRDRSRTSGSFSIDRRRASRSDHTHQSTSRQL